MHKPTWLCFLWNLSDQNLLRNIVIVKTQAHAHRFKGNFPCKSGLAPSILHLQSFILIPERPRGTGWNTSYISFCCRQMGVDHRIQWRPIPNSLTLTAIPGGFEADRMPFPSVTQPLASKHLRHKHRNCQWLCISYALRKQQHNRCGITGN